MTNAHANAQAAAAAQAQAAAQAAAAQAAQAHAAAQQAQHTATLRGLTLKRWAVWIMRVSVQQAWNVWAGGARMATLEARRRGELAAYKSAHAKALITGRARQRAIPLSNRKPVQCHPVVGGVLVCPHSTGTVR